jgi:hypothetical protein
VEGARGGEGRWKNMKEEIGKEELEWRRKEVVEMGGRGGERKRKKKVKDGDGRGEREGERDEGCIKDEQIMGS